MSITINNENNPFFFDANIVDPLVLRYRELRSESEYDADAYSERTALKYIKKISECFDGKIYLLAAGQDVAPPSKIRTKKGVLWQEKELRKLDCRNGEFDVTSGNTRLASLVNLDGFNYDVSEELVLNWVSSLIILTTIDIDILNGYVEGWLVKGGKSVLAFNYDAVAKDLLLLGTTAALRYFPADNGRSEIIVVVGNRCFVEENVANSLDGACGIREGNT